MLCTPSSTFLLRQITVSNSLLICRTPPGSGSGDAQAPAAASAPGIEIRGTNHHILECVPQAADLERIRRLLRDSQWGGMAADAEEGERARKRRKVGDGSAGAGHGGVRGNVSGHGPGKRWTKGQLASVVQASQDELDRGLRERSVIEVDGELLAATRRGVTQRTETQDTCSCSRPRVCGPSRSSSSPSSLYT